MLSGSLGEGNGSALEIRPTAAQVSSSGFASVACPIHSPSCPRTLQALGGNLLAGAFYSATADLVSFLAQASIVHAMLVVGVVRDGTMKGCCGIRAFLPDATALDDVVDAPVPQLLTCDIEPFLFARFPITKHCCCDIVQVLGRMIPVHNLDSLGKKVIYQLPYPRCTIGYEDNLLGSIGIAMVS